MTRATLHPQSIRQVLPDPSPEENGEAHPREGTGAVPAAEQTEDLRIELLGGFRIACGQDEIPDDGWRLAKARSLVKIVALAPGQSILREQLVDLLWPELDPDAGANNLHQALHVARRTLGALFPETKPNRILRLQRGVLSLEPPAPLWIDAESFEREARELQSTDDPASFYPTLDIYRGDLLPDDLYEDWAAERRIALHEQYLSLLDRLAGLHRSRREATPAIDALRRVVAIEPDREEAHRGLMELYALTGRRQQAIRQYERAREILERELELEPEPETDDLYDAILSGAFPAETWEIEAAEPQPVSRPEITESIADFLGRAGDFVGRSEELGILQNALERVIANEGEIILVAGEAGIGKTRMSEEFLRYASAQGVRTLWGRCYEGDGAPAYWPWVQVVRSYMEGRSTAELRTVMGPGAADIARIAPELRERLPDLEEPPPLDPDGERFRLFDSMTTFLKNAAERAPLALIIDDLHSADRSSLLLLEFLAREVAETGLLIVGTYRHVEVDRGHPLTRTLGQLARHEANERITLEGLSVADIDRYIELVTGRAAPEGLAAAIHEQTEGNPFFVREIVALLIEEERLNNPEDVRSWRLTIPHGIRETIALRTARLTDTAHRVLTTASVSGRDFELPIVAQVADLDELGTLDALEEALGAGLIIESPPVPGGFRFTHAITRQTLYDDLSQARRLRMHLRTGEAVEAVAVTSRGSRLLEIAHHYGLAASPSTARKAVAALRDAGTELLGQIAYAEAVAQYQLALSIAEQFGCLEDCDTFDLLVSLGDAHLAEGTAEDAYQTYMRAYHLAIELDDMKGAGTASVGVSDAMYQLESWEDSGIELLEDAVDRLRLTGDPQRVRLLSGLARELATKFDQEPDTTARVSEFSAEALRVAETFNDPEMKAEALVAQQWYRSLTYDPSESLSIAERINCFAELAQDSRLLALANAWRTHYLVMLGNMKEAERAVAAYEKLALETRQPYNRWVARARQAMVAFVHGDLELSEQLATQAAQLGSAVSPHQSQIAHFLQLTAIRREQGRSLEMVKEAERLSDEFPSPSLFDAIRCIMYLDTQRRSEAERFFARLSSQNFDDLPKNLLWVPTVAVLSESAYELGDELNASYLHAALSDYDGQNVSGGGNFVCYGPVSYYLGLLEMILRRNQAASDHLRAARCFAASMGSPLYTRKIDEQLSIFDHGLTETQEARMLSIEP